MSQQVNRESQQQSALHALESQRYIQLRRDIREADDLKLQALRLHAARIKRAMNSAPNYMPSPYDLKLLGDYGTVARKAAEHEAETTAIDAGADCYTHAGRTRDTPQLGQTVRLNRRERRQMERELARLKGRERPGTPAVPVQMGQAA